MTHDLLGLFERFTPKFVKKYANLNAEMKRAFAEYIDEVQTSQFPAAEQTLVMDQAEWLEFLHANEKELHPA